ncbi:mucin-like protein [Rhyzopertha dominica]|nr:mucin-like protein [Rhyzopertha dominica]
MAEYAKELRVVCYYTNWSVYRPGTAKFSPQNINPYLCTHLIYAFGGFTKENTLKPFDKYQDIEKGGYAKFTGLKTYNKNLKTLLAIGGWNEGSSRFSPMVASSERRKELVKNVVKFLRQNHFDGLDLDWEYPSFRDGGKPRDKDNYAHLVQELREEFDREAEKTGRPRLLLTMAVPAGIEYINKGYDVPKLMKYLDWMNILSYDYHSAFEPAVNHHAPLYALEEESEYNYDAELNIDYTIKHYVEAGADVSKLVLGIPTYGRSYTLYNPEANEIGAPADGPGDMGDATRENGYLAYYEICEYVKSGGWKVVQPNPDAMGPYAYKDNQWVGYDDEAIARKKAQYVAEKGLGGIMFWSIDNDDFRGTCHGKPYPLIEAAKEALVDAYGLSDANTISEPAKPLKTKPRNRGKITASSTESTKVKNSAGRQDSGTSSLRRRNRIKTKSEQDDSATQRTKVSIKKDRLNSRRKETSKRSGPTSTTTTTTASSLVVTPSYTTPAPPPTPDPGSDFKCEDEGFFPHPRDCKKYFWCLSSGPSELGIVAHQFTCPSGLYFNKAADSCDYTQNVLCSKKTKAATTTTTTTTTEASSTATTTKSTILSRLFSTSRPPPKITAATSRTSFSTTTTTAAPEEYEEEYEYEDEEEVEEDRKGVSEEDPKVLKELIELIKKAGGLEELEKHLKVHDDGSATIGHHNSTLGSTTQRSIISKSLYERVLSRANARANEQTTTTTEGKKSTRASYTSLNRNSRGPQNEGLEKKEEPTVAKGRPQYTSIARRRPSTSEKPETLEEEKQVEDTKTVETVTEKDEPVSQRSFRRPSQPEYVTIRRTRPTTTTTTEETVQTSTRSSAEIKKKLGEADENVPGVTQIPEYVTVRRQRPSTKQETTTSKYKILRRGTAKATTSTTTTQASTSKPRSTAEPPDFINNDTSESKDTINTLKPDNLEILTTIPPEISRTKSNTPVSVSSTTVDSTEKISLSTEKQSTPTAKISTSTAKVATTSAKVASSTEAQTDLPLSVTPQLFDPRPFSLSTRKKLLSGQTETTTPAAKVSEQISSTQRVRQSGFKEVHDVNNLSTENTLDEHSPPRRLKQRGQSRFTVEPINRNRVRSTQSVEESDKATDEGHGQLQRGRNRFTPPPTTEGYKRPFRPDVSEEVSDLSSLTAADIASNARVSSRANGFTRRNRVRSNETSTTPRSESSTSHRRIDRPNKGIRKTISLQNDAVDEPDIRRNHLRNLNARNPNSQPPSNNDNNAKESNKERHEQSVIRPFNRNRKVIRRLSSSTSPSPLTEGSTASTSSYVAHYTPEQLRNETNTQVSSTTVAAGESENNIQSEAVTTLAPETTTEIGHKQNSTSQNTINSNDDSDDDHEDILKSNEEGENIRLSESNIRENSDISRGNNGNAIQDDAKGGSKVIKTIPPSLELGKDVDSPTSSPRISTTEPNIIVRTRKIVRKLQPTESSVVSSTTASPSTTTEPQNRTRKIIRRLRPTPSTPISSSESSAKIDEDVKLETKSRRPLFTRNRFHSLENGSKPTSPTPLNETVVSSVSPRQTRRRSTTPSTRVTSEEVRPVRLRPSGVRFTKKDSTLSSTVSPKTTEQLTTKEDKPSTTTTTEVTPDLTTLIITTESESGKPTTQLGGDIAESTTINIEDDRLNEILTTSDVSDFSTTTGVYTTIPTSRSPLRQRGRGRVRSTTVAYSTSEITTETTPLPLTTSVSTETNSTNKSNNATENEDNQMMSTSHSENSMLHTIVDISGFTESGTISTTPLPDDDIDFTQTTEDNVSVSATSSTTTTSTAKTTEPEPLPSSPSFKPVRTRPRFSGSKRNEQLQPQEVTEKTRTFRRPHLDKSRATQRRPLYRIKSTTEATVTKDQAAESKTLTSTTETSKPGRLRYNKNLYNRNKFKAKETNSESDEDHKESTKQTGEDSAISTSTRYGTQSEGENNKALHVAGRDSLYSGDTTSQNRYKDSAVDEKPQKPTRNFASRRTTTEKAEQNINDINTSTVSQRNKNLYSKPRKMNIPHPGVSISEATTASTTADSIDVVTEASSLEMPGTTEQQTTLLHVFAVTESMDDVAQNSSKTVEETAEIQNKTIQKVVEISRIVEVYAKENKVRNKSDTVESKTTLESIPVLDRLGEVNRVVEIKVVGGTNESENEIANHKSENIAEGSKREDRKFEIYGGSKVLDFNTKNFIDGSAGGNKHIEIIGSKSHVKTITPNPIFSTDATTIALEGLFMKGSSQPPYTDSDELLHPQNSDIVNVRLLEQDAGSDKPIKFDTESDFVPIRILKPELEMAAKVVEITEPMAKMIRIAPIALQRVGLQRSSRSDSSNTRTTVVFPNTARTRPQPFRRRGSSTVTSDVDSTTSSTIGNQRATAGTRRKVRPVSTTANSESQGKNYITEECLRRFKPVVWYVLLGASSQRIVIRESNVPR